MCEIRNLKNILLCICIFHIGSALAAKCESINELPEWDFNPITAPARLYPHLTNNGTIITLEIFNRTESFNLTPVVIPLNDSEQRCPDILDNPLRLRKLFTSIHIPQNGNHAQQYGKIFNGCYYFQMENEEGKTWLIGPKLFNTTKYTYHDTMFRCKTLNSIHRKGNKSSQVTFELKVPNTCFSLTCSLHKSKKLHDRLMHMNHTSGKCVLIYTGQGNKPIVTCESEYPQSHLITMPANKVGLEGWSTSVTWDNLKDGYRYFTSIHEYKSDSCNISDEDLMTWQPLVNFYAIDHGYFPFIPDPEPTKDNSEYKLIFIASGIIAAGISVYGLIQFYKTLIQPTCRDIEPLDEQQELGLLHKNKQSNKILLIYVKSSPEFIEEMGNLRDKLEQACQCHIHDAYADDQWKLIATVGPKRWVEMKLNRESKVIWIDTPDFRSRLKNNKLENDQQEQSDQEDFRDPAIQCALTSVKDSYIDPTTQYCHHFVVRLTGLEVQDEEGDPLQRLASHTRYYIPKQFSLLCKDLIDSTQPLADTTSSAV